jgi:peptide/nickel transport system permease protein
MRPSAFSRLKRNPAALIGLALVGLYVFVAAAASLLPIADPLKMYSADALSGPSADHLLGTDQFGRDILSRLVFGARVSLAVALSAVGISMLAGTITGLIVGYVGGVLDVIVMRAMDILFSFPLILLALGIIAALGPGNRNLVLAIAVVYTPIFVRMVRGPVLSVCKEEFIEAAHAVGARPNRIILRHILPNVASPIVVQTSLALSWSTLTEASLSFLGLGTQPPLPSWGGMLNEGRGFMELAPWMAIFPGLAITLVVLGFNLLGDGLRDILDPRL